MGPVVTVADVRALALTLPRTTEHLIHDRVKFRVGSIVYLAFSRDSQDRVSGFRMSGSRTQNVKFDRRD